MNRILVWDLPTRLFHWLLAATFAGAAGIALLADDDGPVFRIHMLLGLMAAFMVVLRVIWGFAGTRYARFRSFLFGPGALVAYLRGVLRRSGERFVGHNPGSAYAIYALLILTLGQAASGLLIPSMGVLEELHELTAYLMILTVIVHVTGVVLHTIRHRENITLSMIDGRKAGEASQAIASSSPLAGAAFLALIAGWAFLLINGHDPRSGQLTLFGRTIQLGESEDEEESEEDDDDDDDDREHGEEHSKPHPDDSSDHHDHSGHDH